MCGICGLIEPRTEARDVRMRAMRDSLAHRGPDDAGEFTDDSIALGFRRLSIIDLKGGRQPMAGEDGRCRLVLNGEIYNHRELRRELSAHTFVSDCDAEVVVHAYEEWGARCLDRIHGMFAFAVWDARERVLFAARDRLGKKPFHYRHEGSRFAFASELHALGRGPLEPKAIDAYLSLGYIPSPLTISQGTAKLPPAHWLRFERGRVTVERYWAPPVEGCKRVGVEQVLSAAVKDRLMSDVPLGAFLSGGIDSSIVVGLMSRHSRVKTYSIGFDDPEFDELDPARATAKHFKTDHHEFVVKADAAAVLPELLRHFGEPFGDPSVVPTYYVARETAKHVKVALSGDGGDECFGGYRRHLAIRKLKALKPVAWAVKMLSPFYRPTKYGARSRRVLSKIDRPLGALYRDLVSVFPEEMLAELRPGAVAPTRIDELFAGIKDPVEAAGATDLQTYLPDDVLTKVDIASMASGLEVRCPFLDSSVVGAAFAIPGAEKIRGNQTKAFLRRAFRDLLPAKILNREKMGFGVPVDRWLRGPLRDPLHDLLLDPTARQRGLFQADVVQRLVREHEGGVDHGSRLWLLFVFELWARAT